MVQKNRFLSVKQRFFVPCKVLRFRDCRLWNRLQICWTILLMPCFRFFSAAGECIGSRTGCMMKADRKFSGAAHCHCFMVFLAQTRAGVFREDFVNASEPCILSTPARFAFLQASTGSVVGPILKAENTWASLSIGIQALPRRAFCWSRRSCFLFLALSGNTLAT